MSMNTFLVELGPGISIGQVQRALLDGLPKDTPVGVAPPNAAPLSSARQGLLCPMCGEEVAHEPELITHYLSLHLSQKVQANESVADSFLDCANYSIFGWMMQSGVDMLDDGAFFAGYQSAIDTLRDVTKNRRQKYGAGNLVVHRELGLVVRMQDKVSRLTYYFFGKKD